MHFVTGASRSGTTSIIKWLGKGKDVRIFDEIRISFAINSFLESVHRHKYLFEDREILEPLVRELFYKYISKKSFLINKTAILKEPVTYSGFFKMAGPNYIRNMHQLFPESKMIFMMRHPISVTNSLLKREWGISFTGVTPYQISLDDALKTWKDNARVYIHNKDKNYIYLCRYENLVKHPKEETEKIKNFLSIRHTEHFIVKESKRIDLKDDVVKKILDETKEEREFFGYE